jgi:hypothetical protein
MTIDSTPELVAIAPELWAAELQLQSSIRLRVRMTVARRDGGLWLHSPIAIDEALAGVLAELGEVRHIVAPNRFHHWFAGAAKRRYPAALLWAAPGLREKRSNLAFDRDLGEDAFVGEGIEATFIEGARPWSEHVFFHAETGTMVCTDLLFNIREERHAPTRWLYRAIGSFGHLRTNRVWSLLADDRAALSRSLERLLRWDVRRVIMAHGDPIELDHPDRLRVALTGLMR